MHRTASLTAALLSWMLLGNAWAAPPDATLRFQVLLGDRPIGEHTFRIAGDPANGSVISEAEMAVEWLFLDLYRYQHRSREVFRDGCLREIHSTTLDNGKSYQVEGEADAERLQVRHQDGTTEASGCVMTFAYWTPALLRQERLLNSQTGELEPVRVVAKGRDQIEVAGREIEASRYALSTQDLTIELWYHDRLGWVGLASDTGTAGVLRYRRVDS